ncbi:MAG: MarR family winged helix-turn-helix transcriptional regulator [Deferribacterales bacterium]
MNKNTCMQTIVQIRKLSRFLDKYSKHLDKQYNVTLPQMLCLHEITNRKSLNLTELTKSVNLNNSALTGIVDRLEAKGLVKRTKTETDRRTIYLEATEEGISYTAQLTKKMDNDCFFDKNKLTPEDLKSILETLDKIINSLDPDIKKIELE